MRRAPSFVLFAFFSFVTIFGSANCRAQSAQEPADHSMKMDHSAGMEMNAAGMALMQQASGTSRNPESAPQEMIFRKAAGWNLMFHGVLFLADTQQTGPRGADKLFSANWFMGMAEHRVGKGSFVFRTMLSLEPATVTERRYPELFQTGETAFGAPITDGQHPHDLFMEIALEYARPLGEKTMLNFYAAPVGDPALGPVAFPHRASASEIPQAPLGHHLQDSSHIADEVFTLGVKRGIWGFEASGFHGGEPDENRWNFDFGPLDSVSGRVWFRPNDAWEFQASTGFLRHPEELEPGNLVRTTFSGSWFKRRETDFTAITAGYGVNQKDAGNHSGFFTEATWHTGMNSVYGRFEAQQPEISLLLTDAIIDTAETRALHGTVLALTVGGVRDFLRTRGFELGVGGDVTFYGVPDVLQTGRGFCGTTSCVLGVGYGSRPVSFHVFFRLRPPAPMGRMWNMRMSQPMLGHDMGTMDHKSNQ